MGRRLEVQLEIESRTISALGPAGFHTLQLSEILHVKNAVKRFLPSCYPIHSKDQKEKKNCPLWKGKVGMGPSGLNFIDTYLILLPISGFKKHLP